MVYLHPMIKAIFVVIATELIVNIVIAVLLQAFASDAELVRNLQLIRNALVGVGILSIVFLAFVALRGSGE